MDVFLEKKGRNTWGTQFEEKKFQELLQHIQFFDNFKQKSKIIFNSSSKALDLAENLHKNSQNLQFPAKLDFDADKEKDKDFLKFLSLPSSIRRCVDEKSFSELIDIQQFIRDNFEEFSKNSKVKDSSNYLLFTEKLIDSWNESLNTLIFEKFFRAIYWSEEEEGTPLFQTDVRTMQIMKLIACIKQLKIMSEIQLKVFFSEVYLHGLEKHLKKFIDNSKISNPDKQKIDLECILSQKCVSMFEFFQEYVNSFIFEYNGCFTSLESASSAPQMEDLARIYIQKMFSCFSDVLTNSVISQTKKGIELRNICIETLEAQQQLLFKFGFDFTFPILDCFVNKIKNQLISGLETASDKFMEHLQRGFFKDEKKFQNDQEKLEFYGNSFQTRNDIPKQFFDYLSVIEYLNELMETINEAKNFGLLNAEYTNEVSEIVKDHFSKFQLDIQKKVVVAKENTTKHQEISRIVKELSDHVQGFLF